MLYLTLVFPARSNHCWRRSAFDDEADALSRWGQAEISFCSPDLISTEIIETESDEPTLIDKHRFKEICRKRPDPTKSARFHRGTCRPAAAK
jgi:hypothetical protein